MPKVSRILSMFLLLFPAIVFAGTADSLARDSSARAARHGKPPKHYIKSNLFFSRYGTMSRTLEGKDLFLNNRLGNYSFTQYNLGFYTPLMTRSWYRKDSVRLANFHLLFTFNYNVSIPAFSGEANEHKLFKSGIGLRGIYNTGGKWIWFFDASPFSVGDRMDMRTKQPRYASILVADYVPSADFSLRFGFTRTFLFGNRYHLPMIGMRFGRLDKMYLSIQFPRSVTAAWVVNKNFTLSLYSKPFGGLYRFSNKDTLYINPDVKVLQFGRWELTNGARVDVNMGSNFSMFVSGGISMNNRIFFFSPDFNNNNSSLGVLAPFYRGTVDPTPFLHLGLSVRFGKTKKISGDHRMYEVIDMTNMYDPGDNNDGPGNGQIPAEAKKREMERIKYQDVSDLFDVGDLF